MKLSEMASYIDPVILDRGRNYLSGGHIISLDEVREGTFQAEVEGSELYIVEVELDEDGRILRSECDCPYDFGPICKHQAAVLLKLRGEMSVQSRKGSDLPLIAQKSLKELLEDQNKDTLVQLLLSLAADSDLVEQRIKLHVSHASGSQVLEECRNLIQTYIETYSNGHGFVSWRDVDRAVEGAEIVAEKAYGAMEDADWILAVRLNLCIMEEMIDFLEGTDDSSGTVGGLIERSLEQIHEITDSVEQMSQEEIDKLFRLLLKESQHSLLEGWPDWQLALLESASRLATNDDRMREWEDCVSRMIAELGQGTWGDRYFVERIEMMRYRFLQLQESTEQEKEYLKQHLQFPSFRKLAIQQALDKDQFEEAIRLAEEGEEQDKAQGFPGLVKQWKEFRYEAYRRSGQLEQQRSLGEELAVDGEFSYYQHIKSTYLPSEWPPVYRRMLEKLEKDRWPGSIYTKILIEEQEMEKLLEFVKKHPLRVEEFYSHLVEKFPNDIMELFEIHIENTANRSSTRKDYQNVCRIIRMLYRAGGQEKAFQSIRLLLAKYPRKPAFREELLNLERAMRMDGSRR